MAEAGFLAADEALFKRRLRLGDDINRTYPEMGVLVDLWLSNIEGHFASIEDSMPYLAVEYQMQVKRQARWLRTSDYADTEAAYTRIFDRIEAFLSEFGCSVGLSKD